MWRSWLRYHLPHLCQKILGSMIAVITAHFLTIITFIINTTSVNTTSMATSGVALGLTWASASQTQEMVP